MKKTILITLVALPLTLFAQEIPTEFLDEAVEQSKRDLEAVVASEDLDRMRPLEVEVKKGMFYVIWGYHRGFHSKSDVTFKTPDGTFTIHDVVGEDRPSHSLDSYVDPTQFTKPQYNIKIGYMLNDHFSVEVGTDHMKWVMDSSRNYKVTGEYNRPIWGQEGVFEDMKENGYRPFIHLEHTDGYNYPHASLNYHQNLLRSRNKKWALDAVAGAGAGILVTKTNLYIADNFDGTNRHEDSRFRVAGAGAHLDGRLKFSFTNKSGKQFFILSSARGSVGKIENAPFLNSYGGSIEHTPIYSLQLNISGGVSIPVFNRKAIRK